MGKTVLTQEEIEFLINVLRRGSIKWSGRRECLNRARKKVFVRTSLAGKPIYKYHWQCAKCSQWFRNEKDMEVDHIEEIGSFNGNWHEYVEKVFSRQSNLQCLCLACHLRKTAVFNSAMSRYKRKK